MRISDKDTKIICTIGPGSAELKTMKQMYANGMSAVRINTAHMDFNFYKKIIVNARKVDDIPIILDVKGPELRITSKEKKLFPRNSIFRIGFSRKSPHADIFLNHNVIKSISRNDRILIEDGKYSLRVVSKSRDFLTVKSNTNTVIENNKNVNIPNKKLNLPHLNRKDIKAIEFAKKHNAEFIALSFCRSKKDVNFLRKKLGKSGIKIIAKIENREGIDNIGEIVDSADGIMVARGDLGVELPPEEVPLLQKQIINECNNKGKLVIVATQMLESMTQNPTPTRAEISDIANAILDGADCLMLSEETAIGHYPAESVRYMSKVALEVEPQIVKKISSFDSSSVSDSISRSVYTLTETLPITKIVCFTVSGHTATKIARFRLDLPIYAITNSELIKRQLMLYFSVRPLLLKTDFMNSPVLRTAKHLFSKKILMKNDTILFTAGLHTLKGKKTNTIQIHQASDLLEYVRKKSKSF